MSAYPGMARTKELPKRSFNGPPRFLEHSPPPVDKKVRTQAVDSPYFKSQSNGDIVPLKFAQKVKDVSAKFDRTARISTPRLDPRDVPVSPPLLKRNSDPVASVSSVTDVLPCFEIPGLPIHSPNIQPSQLSARDARAVTDVDLLHAMNLKPRRGPSDDNSSIFSEETRLSGSTSSRTKENTCRECKFKGHANLPLIRCSTCTNRFHANEKCINPELCDVKNKEVFRCRQCVSKGRTRIVTPLPNAPAEDVPTLPLTSSNLTPRSDAFAKSTTRLLIAESDGQIETKKDTHAKQPDHDNTDQMKQGKPEKGVAPASPSDSPDGLVISRMRRVDMSIVPKEPAAMREPSSPILHRLPHMKNLMDSYRPDHPATSIATRGHDVYRPSERSRPSTVHLRREREIFLRSASKDERDHYLRQNRKDICKEITCPQWGLTGKCRKRDKCLYGHEETDSYFPSKAWTCGAWLLGRLGCREREENCVFAHYDTGVYADVRGEPSMKHVTCFWWSRDDLTCRYGAGCRFAHRETGIVAEDPVHPRRERSPPLRRPSSSTPRTSDSWRPEATILNAAQPFVGESPPPVRDTPLSPIVPSESESEDYEPSLSHNPSHRDHHTGLSVISAQPQLQTVTKPSPTAELGNASTAAHGGGLLDGLQLDTLTSSATSEHLTALELDVAPVEEPAVVPLIHGTVPKQYARRTGGLKLHRATDPRRRKQARSILEHSQYISSAVTEPPKDEAQDVPTQPIITSDPRRRKPTSSSLEPIQNINGDKTRPANGEVKGESLQTENILQPAGIPGVLKCQNCTKFVLLNQAANHKCQGTVSGQVNVSPQPLSSAAFSKERDVTDCSNESHFLVQNLPMDDQVNQVNEPNVTIALDNVGQVHSRNLPASSAPETAIHGPKRSASGSGVDDLFFSNKRRKMGPPITAQASVPVSVSPKKVAAVSLSIEDLTELAALRKEFDRNEESQSDDDATTLQLLQAKKRRKTDREERMAREEKAEEAAHKAKVLEEKEKRRKKWEAEEAADEARRIAEKEKRLKKWEEELAQEERDRKAFKEIFREQAAQGRRKSPNQDVETAAASHSSTSPSGSRQGSTIKSAQSSLRGASITAPGHESPRQSSDECPAATQELEKRFNGVFSVISPNLGANPIQASAPLSTSPLQDGASNQNSILKNRPELVPTSSDEEDIEHDEARTQIASMYSQLGLERTACEPCQKRRIKCRHHRKLLGSIHSQPQPRSLESSAPISELQQMYGNSSSLLEADRLEPGPKGEDAQDHQSHIRACVSCQKSKRKCDHDLLTGNGDPVRAELPPKKRQRITPNSSRTEPAPVKSATPQASAIEPMVSSIVASKSATKTATSAFAQEPSAIAPVSITADPATTISGDNHTAQADKSLVLLHPPNTNLSPPHREDDMPRSCANCRRLAINRLRGFGSSRRLLCDSCYMYNYHSKTSADRPINHELNSENRAADDSSAPNSPSVAAKTFAAKAIAKTSAPAPSSVAPAEILALFCQPLRDVETHRAANKAVPWCTLEQDNDYAGPRLVQSRVLNEEEKAAAIARMRVQGIEVISVSGSDSDSDSSWSGSEVGESSFYPFQPIPLVKSARYEEEPDPRRWVDEIEDQKAKTFDMEAAQKRIKARPGLKENVKALQNYTKPGKLLAISDWRNRIQKYGSVHRETERDPGPQKLGSYIREVADRTKLTIPRGFDDPEVMKEEVQGTMQEFLGLPKQMKYDLTDSDRLVGARTLAFSDAAGRGRVPDKDKFPVGKGA